MRLETDIETKACDLAFRRLGIRNIKVNTRSEDGWPDRMFLLPYSPLFVEFKRPGEPVRPLQEYIHEQLRALGYRVEVHDTVDGALDAIVRALAEISRFTTK